MSGYTFESTAVTSAADCKALPRTGREDPVGVAGNTVFFSKGPEQDIEETEGPAFLVRLVSPVGAEFTVPAHWHPNTDEYFRVFVGSIDVTLDGVKRTLTPADGEVHIPRRSVHSIHIHKDVYGEFGERADPNPIRKMRFLKHILTNGGQATPLTPVQAMRVFYEDGDGFPSTGFKPFDICLVYVLGGLVGHFLGFGKIREAERAKTK